MIVRTALAAAATVCAALPAGALDLPGSGVGPAGGWSGPYLAATLGAAGSTGEARRGAFAGDLIELDVRNGLFPASIDDGDVGLAGGLGVGYDVQRGALVAGVSLDLFLADSEVSAAFSRRDPNPDPVFNGVETRTGYGNDLDGLATLRLRAGRDLGGALVFASAGLAAGAVRNSFTLELSELGYANGWSEDGTRFGFAVGLGAERRLSERVSLRAELLYYDLADATVEATDPATFPGQSIEYRFENSGTIGQVGVVFRF